MNKRTVILSILTLMASALLIIAIIVPDRNHPKQNEQNSQPETQQSASNTEENKESGNSDEKKDEDNIANDNAHDTAETQGDYVMNETGTGHFETEEHVFDNAESENETQVNDTGYSSESQNEVHVPAENTSGSETETGGGTEETGSESYGPGGRWETPEDTFD